MAYFDTKKDSLEEAIKAAVKNEKLDAVNKTAVKKKFDDRKDKDIDNDGDVDASDKYLHKRRKAVSKAIKSEDYLDEKNKIGSKEVDFELFSGEKGEKQANAAMNKEIRRASQMKDYKSARAYMDKVQTKYSELGAEDSESQRTIDAILGAVFKEAIKSEDLAKDDEKSVGKVIKGLKKAVKIHQGQVDSLSKDIKDSYEYGTPEATKNSLNMTPGQSSQEWDEQVGLMHKKQNTMREALAKMWGVEEGHNPFKKDIDERFTRLKSADLAKARKKAGMPPFKKGGYTSAELKKFYDDQKKNKKEDKTMTGKPATKVSVNSDGKKD